MVVFVDVDTQNDFMNDGGALYVPKAEFIKPVLKQLTDYAVENNILVLATADCHYGHEEEFRVNGGPFPFHCMMRQPGADKIPETTIAGALDIPTDCAYDATPTKGQLIFQKQCYDVFAKTGGNDDFEKIFERIGETDVVVYGVATDYCVKAAVLGLLDTKGVGEVFLVIDAIMGVDVEEGDSVKALGDMIRAGALTCVAPQVTSGKIK